MYSEHAKQFICEVGELDWWCFHISPTWDYFDNYQYQ